MNFTRAGLTEPVKPEVNKMFDAEKKSQYWNHFTDETLRSFRPKKITDFRLKLIKELVLNDDFLWQTVIPHSPGLNKTPNELRESSPPDYRRTRANFWAMIREKIQFQLAQSTE